MASLVLQRSVFCGGPLRRMSRVAAAAAVSLLSTAANAQQISDLSRGAYTQAGVFGTGGAGQADGNYLTGAYGSSQFRSFFVFNLSGVGTVTSATLLFTDVGYSDGTDPRTLNLFDYLGSISALTSGGAGVAGYNDLGSGALFGSTLVPVAGNAYSITLNNAGISAINSAAGGQIAFGGALSAGGTGDQFVFGDTLYRASVVLSLNSPVPEPSAWAMMLLGFCGIGVAVRRRKEVLAQIA